MTAPTIESVLADASALLAGVGESEWSAALDVLRARCPGPAPDQDVIREILRLYGGMGSFSDIVLYDKGKVLVHENERLDALRRTLFELARSLVR